MDFFELQPSGALKFIPKLLADTIMQHYTFITLADTKEIYVYDETQGIYKPRGENLIRTLVAINLEHKHRKNYGEEVLYHIKVSTFRNRNELELPDGVLVLKNGIFYMKTRRLGPFMPRVIAFNNIPVNYNPEADCPTIKRFISEVVTEDDAKVLQEALGYTLKNGYLYQKAFMLVGDGANGKSTFLSLMIVFLGPENISSISLQDLVTHKFAAAELYGKRANIYDDLSHDALKRTGQFKMATGGGMLKGEKKFQHPFFFKNEAKLFFSTNQVPEAYDNTTAFFRRWVIINFPNKFLENADPKLLSKLTTEEELSGFFNWALEGLEQLDKQEGFSYTKTIDEVQRQYERMSNSIKAFRMDHLMKDPESVIPKNDLYGYYVSYCIEHGLPAKAKNAFSMALYQVIPEIAETRKRIGKNRIQCWQGVRFSEDIIEENPDHPDQKGENGQGGQPGQGISIFKSKKTCARCGLPLNAETGEFMDNQTMRHYCRQCFTANKRAEEGS
jgi:putative DNA primase/helicase